MFRILEIDLIHWDFWQAVKVPLDAQIVTIIGPNGSGKTTLLDALRTLLALDCSGRRDYKRYVRNARAPYAWLRGVVANPRLQGLFPYPFWPLKTPEVTLFCRIRKQGGDWMRQYAIAEGNVPMGDELEGKLEWLGVNEYRRRLEQAGLTPAIAKVLALEQGDTDKLCDYSPKGLLDLVFQVFGDKQVLDHYADAKEEQRRVEHELTELKRSLSSLENEVERARGRANRYLEWKQLSDDVVRLEAEVLPRRRVLDREREVNEGWRDYRLAQRNLRERRIEAEAAQQELNDADAGWQAAKDRQLRCDGDKDAALKVQIERQAVVDGIQRRLRERERLQEMAREHPDAAALAEREVALRRDLKAVEAGKERIADRQQELTQLKFQLDRGQMPMPREVAEFRHRLDEAGIVHDMLTELVEISDVRWQPAVEAMLRGYRHIVLLRRPEDRRAAREHGQKLKYRHFIVDERAPVPRARSGSLLEMVSFHRDPPAWLAAQLNRVTRVESVADGDSIDGDWITPDAYLKESRGTRSIAVDPIDFHFGAATRSKRLRAIEDELDRLGNELLEHKRRIGELESELKMVSALVRGADAARLLAEKGEEIAAVEAELPAALAALQEAREALAAAEQQAERARTAERDLYTRRLELDRQAKQLALQQVDYERNRRQARDAVHRLAGEVRQLRHGMPATWLSPQARAELAEQFGSVGEIEREISKERHRLATGDWEQDPSTLQIRDKLVAECADRVRQMQQIEGQLVRAGRLTDDARSAYVNKLKATVRLYGRNLKHLGQLAGIDVETTLPELADDDTTLSQAGLVVCFNFDQKGMMGLNDGEASGGQQVMKSLILLIGLMMNDSNPSGFVFIDEPFAHLDVINIDRVGAFLKATQAQYLITTPNTHNVNIFEPSELTLTTRKKRPGEVWAPPLLQTRRRVAAETRRGG